MRQLNRPAILTLVDKEGNSHQAVLAALNDDTAQIRVGDVTHEVTIAAVSRYWFGEYLILWRPHSPEPHTLSVGMREEGVRWLRKSLESAQGRPTSDPGSDYYDETLAAMVESFQREHRLEVDGIAGLQTQILLDTLTGSGSPVLVAASKGG